MTDIKNLERTLWTAADKLRSNMDAAEYKHVVLGLIFLKYISDAFNTRYDQLKLELEDAESEWYVEEEEGRYHTLNDKDEYLSHNIFFVPEKARWSYLQSKAKLPEIGKLVDDAMDEIERLNPSLKGVLPKIYADPDLNKQRLGELIDLIGTIGFNQPGHKAKDLLGRVYEYFLGQFADAEGKSGGQFYTPASIVKLLVEMLEPYKGRVYDGCCGSGGMFVQSEKFLEEHGGRLGDLSVFGQESNPTTMRLAKMNLAIRGIDAKIELGDTFLHDRHKDLKADFIMANPPFNISDWSGEQLREDARWKYGAPPVGNANYAWLQHFVHKLSPNGTAGIVLANGSMNSNTGSEGDIRKAMIEAGLVDCMVALPSQLFYNTMIPACLWFLVRKRQGTLHTGGAGKGLRDRSNEILFIDARKMGVMVSRRNRELADADIQKIAGTYHHWRNTGEAYADVAGFCKAATLDEVRANNYVLMPGRYVGTEAEEDDGVLFADKIAALTTKLAEQFAKGHTLEAEIRENLKSIGYEF
ncbi:type I restriction enzyme M protein [Cnuella takakiae]|uniref:site-specific DNA-methyltransferase (adenine-specific) n=1 Tax=Cnuella takakiae TaxID=1302690 RepID=A0A1M4SEU4_9BACT|nr:class I SAM-dependent DNA methyltransferase [Cnuella takakiae]OLY94485.1 N-6 DNA methylase [Cnuella takakiae]SHE30711.1 type I restriction enzyme M protein [Cnuella takakiae]